MDEGCTAPEQLQGTGVGEFSGMNSAEQDLARLAVIFPDDSDSDSEFCADDLLCDYLAGQEGVNGGSTESTQVGTFDKTWNDPFACDLLLGFARANVFVVCLLLTENFGCYRPRFSGPGNRSSP